MPLLYLLHLLSNTGKKKILPLLLITSLAVDVETSSCNVNTSYTCTYEEVTPAAIDSQNRCNWVAEGKVTGLADDLYVQVTVFRPTPVDIIQSTPFCAVQLNDQTCADDLYDASDCGCKKDGTDWKIKFSEAIENNEDADKPFEYKVEAFCRNEDDISDSSNSKCTTASGNKVSASFEEPKGLKVQCTADDENIQLVGPHGHFKSNSWDGVKDLRQATETKLECCVSTLDTDLPVFGNTLNMVWKDMTGDELAKSDSAVCLKYTFKPKRKAGQDDHATLFFDYRETAKCGRGGQVQIQISGIPTEEEELLNIEFQVDDSYEKYQNIALFATLGAFVMGAVGTMVYGFVAKRMNDRLDVINDGGSKRSSGIDLQPDASHEAIVDSRDAMEMLDDDLEEA